MSSPWSTVLFDFYGFLFFPLEFRATLQKQATAPNYNLSMGLIAAGKIARIHKARLNDAILEMIVT